jgi:hypothetical protein
MPGDEATDDLAFGGVVDLGENGAEPAFGRGEVFVPIR